MHFRKEREKKSEVQRRERWNTWGKIGGGVLLAVFIFALGVNMGSGRISFYPNHGQTGLPDKLDYTTVNNIYQAIKTNYNGKLTGQQMIDGLKHGLAEATNDPYTEYFTPKEAKDFNNEVYNNSAFSGIGAELGQDKDKNLIVISPIVGFPAEKAGLKAQDIITSIDGTSTAGMSVDEAVTHIRGPKGSKVTLGVVRDRSQTLSISIVRETIQLPSVNSKILDGNVGYLQITQFSGDTVDLARKAAEDFQQKQVKGVILDLRGDPGGLLDAAVSVSSLWVPEGKAIVTEKGTIGSVSHPAEGGSILNGLPTVVLLDAGSASAAEITAGALHDNGVAYLIGEKSFGKGVVQQIVNFPDGSELKVTVASWYRPNGQNINHKGITPDKTVKISDADQQAKNDTQLQAAQDYLSKK